MTASYAAWPPGTDPALLRREVAHAHEEFLATGRSPARLRDVVRDSWQRCFSGGVNPEGTPRPPSCSGPDLRDLRRQHPLHAVMPVIRRLLVDQAQGNAQLVAVGDENARLLWVEGDRGLVTQAEGIGFVEGSDWTEQSAGTNAPGTALALGKGLQVYASEHFSRPVQPWSCSAAPIHDPDTGAVLGVIDLTGGDHIASPHALSLVLATVAAAEGELRLLRVKGVLPAPHSRRTPAPAPTHPHAPVHAAGAWLLEVLGRDRGRLTGPHGRIELSPRHSEILFLLSSHPRGLTADELGVRLHEEESARVTVRAEMSRLRRLLGAGLLGSRPYRLLGSVTTDAAEVHRLLARGAHRRALAACAGPLLPRSEAPGVVEARDALVCEVRGSLLRRADAQLLVEWVDRPEHADDVELLRAAERALPPGSPRRPMLRGRLERLVW